MAIVGIGTDIVEIARLAANEGVMRKLMKRILTEEEQAIAAKLPQPHRFLAKRFAVKEAAVKALGTGIGRGVSFQHIHVSNNDAGAPQIRFTDEFARLCETKGVKHAFVSIADEQSYAVATVVLES